MKKLVCAFAAGILPVASQAATTWKDQADRLSKVSATLLDAYPVSSPISKDLVMGADLLYTLLPPLNTTVGGKSEKVPSSPFHISPTFFAAAPIVTWDDRFVAARFSLGGLIPGLGAEEALGLKAELGQITTTGEIQYQQNITSEVAVYGLTGFHFTYAQVEGAITDVDACEDRDLCDTFNTVTLYTYAGVGAIYKDWVWTQAVVGYKDTRSTLKIESDGVERSTQDTLSDLDIPLVTQVSFGTKILENFDLAFSQTFVWQRAHLPRFSMKYTYQF